MPLAQLDHHLLRRLVLDRRKFLQHGQPTRLQLVFLQMRAAQHVGINRQRLRQVLGQRGAAVSGVGAGNRLAPLDAEIVQIEDELVVVAIAGAAQRHLAGETAQPAAIGRIVDAAGRQQKREGGRLQPVHRFGDQHQSVRICVGED